MRSFTTILATTVFAALPLLGTGCVDQTKYDQMLMTNRSLQEQAISLEAERDEARANLDTVRGQLAQASTELNGLKSKYGLMDSDLAKMAEDYRKLMEKVGTMDFGPLPEDLNRALTELAAQYPDMMTFDAKRGMLRFASDFTFALGSAELNSNAASTISKLAQVLNSGTASNFEVHVVGHTDSVQVSNPNTKRMFPTNMYLSAGRAISVQNALTNDGVAPKRVMIAGWGEYRPTVTNNPGKSGTPQNRRVEIYLMPMSDTAGGGMMAETSTPTKKIETVSGEPMK